MARYRTTIHTTWSVEDAFRYMSDLRNFEEWDPGVRSSVMVVGAEPGLGAEYDVKVSATTLRYVTLVYEQFHQTVVEATSKLLRSYDKIEVSPTATGCDVVYDATLEFNGALKFADPLLGVFFKRIGDKAAAGMAKALSGDLAS